MTSRFHRAFRLRAGGLCLLGVYALVSVSCGGTEASADLENRASVARPSLEPTFASADALAEAIVGAMAREDGEALRSYTLTKEQFRLYVWPQLPSSRPERGVSFEFGWGDLHQKSHNSLLRSFDRYRGRPMEFLEVRFEDGVTDYDTYLVHRDARVKVRFEDGREEWLDLFGSVMERQGKFKLFSYVTD